MKNVKKFQDFVEKKELVKEEVNSELQVLNARKKLKRLQRKKKS